MDVGLEFARRPEEFAKPEALPDRPPTPDPEKQSYEATNISAVTLNSDTDQMPVSSKPFLSVTTPPAAETLADAPLQPVQQIHLDAIPQNQSAVPQTSSTDHVTFQSGDAKKALPVANGGLGGLVNGNLESLSVSDLPEMEATSGATGLPASSSSLPLPDSFHAFVPPIAQIEIQNAVQTDDLQESLEPGPGLQPTPEQPPTSDSRATPQALHQDSEAVVRTKADLNQQDLASSPDLTQGLAVGGNHAVEQSTTPQPGTAVIEGPPTDTASTKTSIDAPTHQASTLNDASFPSPPPPPEPAHATLPVERHQISAPTSTAPEPSDHLQADEPMVDAAPPPSKMSRGRDEEGDEHGPAAKRLKAEDDVATEPEFKVPEAPAHSPTAEHMTSDPAAPADDTVTAPRLAHMKKVIGNLKKSSISQAFREPVNYEKLNLPRYPEIIKQPMDLGTVDKKLKGSAYNTVSDFVTDFNLIVNNCITFNGTGHDVAQAALKMKQSFENQMRGLPPANFAVPAKEEKKPSKIKEHPVRAASQRRSSTSHATAVGATRSPATPGSAQTFALGPEGVPLIRRDSTVADGRPKRAIHPPKRRDTFGPGRPRKKKFEWQLKFCKEVVNEMKKPKYYSFAQYFYYPVDPVALNIPSYHKVIKKPIDLDTVEKKLDSNQYEKARDFEEDARQIFRNCYLFNQPGDFVYTSGQQFEKMFEDKWATKDEWLASHEPASEPQSPGDEDEEDEASDQDEDDSADERTDEIAQLKAQIAMMSQTIGNLQSGPKKKKKTTPPAPAVPKKSGKAKKKDKPASFPGLQQTNKEKKKSVTKAKPEKEHFVTYNEKQYISTGISSLPDARMSEALKIIQSNVPSLKNTHETEIELDIDELPNHVLLKLLNFVKKHGENAPPEPEPPQQPAYAAAATAPGKPKKNKPMSKLEQEQQIRELKGKLGAYDGGQTSPDPIRSIEKAGDSSGDDDSEESEEE